MKKTLLLLLLALPLALRAQESVAPSEQNDTVRILGVGNSWTRDSMRQLWAIAHSAGRNVIVGHAYLGGSRLEDQFLGLDDTTYCYTHAKQPQKVHSTYQYWKYKDGPDPVKEPAHGYRNGLAGIGVTLERAVSDEPWDWIVFQPEATFGGDFIRHMGQTDNGYDLRLFKERILQMLPAGAQPRIGLMVPFAYPQGNTDYRTAFLHYYNNDQTPKNQAAWDVLYKLQYQRIQSVARPVATYIGADAIINVGAVIEAAREDAELSKAGYLLQRAQNNTHLAEGLPMYIASLCYAYMLLGALPETITFYPADNSYTVSGDRGETLENGFVLTEDLARKARELTWKAVETSVK